VAQIEAYYDAELAWIDQNLARLLARQEQRGELENTLIVVVADHGEAFFEHGRYGHRFDLYDEVLRIPLIVWAPGRVPAGRVIDESVSIVDVLPTLMDYAGLPAEHSLDGRSLRPVIDGGRLPSRPVTAALTFIPAKPQGHYLLHEAIVQEGLKLVRHIQVPWSPDNQRDIGQAPLAETEQFEIFDLTVDPGEKHDLVGSGDPRVEQITEAFGAERQRQRERLASFQPRGSGAPITDLSVYESMDALGYLQRGQ
jgi:arylsulfatase A-like enzyme